MGFVNEIITQEDRINYDLDEVESRKSAGVLIPEISWTIDKERRIYLRKMRTYNGSDIGDYTGKNLFYFYWENEIYELTCYLVKSEKINNNRMLKSTWLIEDIKNFNKNNILKKDFFDDLTLAFNVPSFFLKDKLDVFICVVNLSELLIKKIGE